MSPGTRVIVTERSVWPERIGCVGTIVEPPVDGTYPQPGRSEVLVLLDDDPLGARHDMWSCVMNVRDVRPLSPSPTTKEPAREVPRYE